MIHSYANRCPYCSKDIMPQMHFDHEESLQKGWGEQALVPTNPLPSKNESSIALRSQTFYVLLSLVLLLAGSCFFFFGILIKLFSYEGVFTLEWNGDSWPYFVFSAFFCIALGLATFSKIEK